MLGIPERNESKVNLLSQPKTLLEVPLSLRKPSPSTVASPSSELLYRNLHLWIALLS